MTETRAKLERDLDQILAEIRSQFKGERALDSGLLKEALDVVTQQAIPETVKVPWRSESSPTQPNTSTYLPTIIPSARLFIETSALVSQPPSLVSEHPRSPETKLPTPAESASDIVLTSPAISIFKHENGRIYANSEGLTDHLFDTGVSLRAQIELGFFTNRAAEDPHFKGVMLGTYLDYTTPQEMFDQIERRFEEVKPDSPDYSKRSRCVHLPCVPRREAISIRGQNRRSNCRVVDHRS
jgi:hypothetical protein